MTRKTLASAFTFVALFVASSAAFAADETAALTAPGAFGLFSAAFAIAVAAVGGALGQGRAAAAALDGIARNPGASGKLFVPMILGLALIESLVIYALVIAFQIVGKV